MRWAVLLALLVAAGPAWAADRAGRFAVDGAGAAPCPVFLDARAKRDQRYFMFGGWFDGFFSAMNIYERDAFDLTPWQSTDLIAAAVAQVCEGDRRLNVERAVALVAQRLMATRLRERQALSVAGGVPLYPAVVSAAQARLRALGFLRAAPTGRWDAPTAAAVRAFQQARRVPVTGGFDQVTLYLLLAERPPAARAPARR